MLAALREVLALSEPGSIDAVLRAAEVDWLRWMVSALGQTRRPGQTRLVVKLDAWAIFELPLVREAFPDVRCVFVYRDPVEVVVSHLGHRGYHTVTGTLPPEWLGLSEGMFQTLEPEQYIAAVVGAICDAAVTGARVGALTLLNYDSLPDSVAALVAPLFGIDVRPGRVPTGSITYTLFGPNNSACTGTAIFTSTVNSVNGNGNYASQAFTTSAAGTYNWVATYSGDTNNAGAAAACGSANSSVVVTPAATQTTLVSSLNPAAAGQAVAFTATVAGTNPTGTVTFMDGSSALGTGTLGASGAATFTTSSLSAARHSITAVYGGDPNNTGSTSNAVTEVVNGPASPSPGAPSVSITSPASGAEYRFGQVVQAAYSCTEGANGPGIQSCTGPVPSGSPIDTSTAGKQTFAVTAVSKDGQSTTKSVVYTVKPNNEFTISRVIARASGTVTFQLEAPGAGVLDVLETAWFSDVAHVSSLLQPAPDRFVFARAHVTVRRTGSVSVTVTPNSAGRKLLAHHTYSPVLRLWLSFTPDGGSQRNFGFYGLHLPTSPSSVEKCVPANLPNRITHEPLRCHAAPAHGAKARA